jgi:hypothetical protein
MKTRSCWLLALSLWAVCSVSAQPYPNKPIKFVVGYPPGGSGDFVTRTVGEAIAAELGQSAVIDNRPGAAGNLASELVNKSPADGYTLLVASNPYINKALYKKLNYDIEKDFTPTYNPWDQRLCLAPNGDFFHAMRDGKASVVTDTIDTFDETGIVLSSGEHLDADVIVTATGLQLVTLGEVQFEVDGKPVDFAQTWTYKGVAYSGVPNLASSFGYINASWTLRSDLTCEYVCRLLNHMAKTGTTQCTPRLRDVDQNMPESPWIDSFSAGYMRRVMHLFPRQGNHAPWINPQNFARDKKMFRRAPLDDGAMQFTKAPVKQK